MNSSVPKVASFDAAITAKDHARGSQPAVGPGLAELLKVGKLALFHKFFGQIRVLSVQTQNNDPPDSALAQSRLPPQCLDGPADRPGEEREESQKEGNQDDQKGRDKRDPGPGTYISLDRDGREQESSQKQEEPCPARAISKCSQSVHLP